MPLISSRHLSTILPKDFSELQTPLAVGVIDFSTKEFSLVCNGDLRAAVAASCAIPLLFKPVIADSPPRLCADGGIADRTGLRSWRSWEHGYYSFLLYCSCISSRILHFILF